mgnify:CR=1 FL=1
MVCAFGVGSGIYFTRAKPEEGRGHWGHAISEDLIHWNDLPYALYPESEEDCFSGTCFVEEDRVISAYYGHQSAAGLMVAVSDDPLLLNWETVTGKANKTPAAGFLAAGVFTVPLAGLAPTSWKVRAPTAGQLADSPPTQQNPTPTRLNNRSFSCITL